MIQDASSSRPAAPVEPWRTSASRQEAPKPGQAQPALLATLSHRVEAGETLSGIATRYLANKPADMDLKTWIDTLQVMNGLDSRQTIRVGQVLTIPQLALSGERLDVTPKADTPFSPDGGVTFPAGGAPPTADQPACDATLPDWRTDVLTTAKDSLGVRYVWGGTNLAKGVDCSGLTQQVFDQIGVALPRTSSEQFRAGGAAVARADLQPGDLVFFRNTKGRICHVGIYAGVNAAGRQEYISATNSKGVAQVAIDDWIRWNPQQRYAGARRFEASPATP